MEEPSLTARRAIFTGYLFHSLYIVVELGDGEFFRIPFLSIRLLKWSEEFFELFFLASYLLAFVLIHMSHSNDKKRVKGVKSRLNTLTFWSARGRGSNRCVES